VPELELTGRKLSGNLVRGQYELQILSITSRDF